MTEGEGQILAWVLTAARQQLAKGMLELTGCSGNGQEATGLGRKTKHSFMGRSRFFILFLKGQLKIKAETWLMAEHSSVCARSSAAPPSAPAAPPPHTAEGA